VSSTVAPAHARTITSVGARGEIRLDADDWLDAVVSRLLPKVKGTECVAVIGDRDRRHALLSNCLHQLADACCAVKHRVLTVHVQVHEAVLTTGHAEPLSINHIQATRMRRSL